MMSRTELTAVISLCFVGLMCSAQQQTRPTLGATSQNPGAVIGGDGSANYIPIWATGNYLRNSVIYENGANVGVGTTSPEATLDVNGAVDAATGYAIAGVPTLSSDPSVGNLFIGYRAGSSSSDGSQNNLFVGEQAGINNTSGNYNSFVGYAAGFTNITGYDNSFSGMGTGFWTRTGHDNTFVGLYAGDQNDSGSFNIFVGAGAGYSNVTGSSDIYIGYPGPVNGQSESATIRIGWPGIGDYHQNTTYIAGIYNKVSSSGVSVFINTVGQLGTQPSSSRFKDQIEDMGNVTSGLMSLRPVTFVYKAEFAGGDQTTQYGSNRRRGREGLSPARR